MERQQQAPRKWQARAGLVASLYRIVALVLGAFQMLANPAIYHPGLTPSVLSPSIFITTLSLYTLVISFYISYICQRYRSEVVLYVLLCADVIMSIWVLTSTGGLQSPFLLLTIAPVLTAALFLDIWAAVGITVLSGAYIICIELYNGSSATLLSPLEVSYFLVYMIALCLIASLPYLINVNVRERLKRANILQERQRLSRELHDGDAQTVSALRWKVQSLHRRLAEKGIDLDEMREVEKLAEKAQWEIRESLELLRNYTGDGSFLPHLKDYIEHVGQETGIKFRLDVPTNGLHLDSVTELELLRICQEALVNIKNHSDAHNVQVAVEPVDSHLRVSISDDGRGFDIRPFYRETARSKGHGLAVMNERAQSLGGKFRVLSLPGRGSEVQVEVPMVSDDRRRSPWKTR
ncbi:MAG: sensor histidine kinase [Chloroflexota bacterium]